MKKQNCKELLIKIPISILRRWQSVSSAAYPIWNSSFVRSGKGRLNFRKPLCYYLSNAIAITPSALTNCSVGFSNKPSDLRNYKGTGSIQSDFIITLGSRFRPFNSERYGFTASTRSLCLSKTYPIFVSPSATL